jgi:hypothetical protein
MAIKDSRVFCSSALLRDWKWNGFDNFLKLIRSSSHFCCFAMHSSLCSCRFGHEDIYKKINPGLSRVWPGRPGQFPACFLLRPGPTTDPGRPAGPGLKTLPGLPWFMSLVGCFFLIELDFFYRLFFLI